MFTDREVVPRLYEEYVKVDYCYIPLEKEDEGGAYTFKSSSRRNQMQSKTEHWEAP